MLKSVSGGCRTCQLLDFNLKFPWKVVNLERNYKVAKKSQIILLSQRSVMEMDVYYVGSTGLSKKDLQVESTPCTSPLKT